MNETQSPEFYPNVTFLPRQIGSQIFKKTLTLINAPPLIFYESLDLMTGPNVSLRLRATFSMRLEKGN